MKFPLIWNMAFVAYLEGGREDGDDDEDDDDDGGGDKSMRTALSQDKPPT